MPATITRSPRKATPRSDKVSVTLRIPTELKSWADEFASKSHLDLSGLFIQSLRETQQRGVLRIAPFGYKDEEVRESDFSPEVWKEIQESIREFDKRDARGELEWQDWDQYKNKILKEISLSR